MISIFHLLKHKKYNGLIMKDLQLEFTGGLTSELIKMYFSFYICIRN